MKKLLLLLSLCGVSLQAANSDAFELDAFEQALSAMDLSSGGAPAPVKAITPQLQATQNDPLPVTVKTSDGKEINLEDCTLFPTLSNLVGDIDLDIDSDQIIPLPSIDSHYMNHVKRLYNDKNYFLPVTQDKLKEERIDLPTLLKTLNFLGSENYLEKLYTAWLNSPQNKNAVVHHNVPTSTILEQMSLPAVLSDTISQRAITLNTDDVSTIENYSDREHRNVSIQNLINAKKIPAIVNNRLYLRNKNISSLIGLKNIPKIKTVTSFYLDYNKIIRIAPGTFTGFTALTHLSLSNNQITEIAPGVFTGLTALGDLYLDDNQIAEIAPEIFTELIALQLLTLYNNQVSAGQQATIEEEVPQGCNVYF
jgi:hypothetical protein